ncbi:alkylation response protein AidB-like acyl-CoA dehydrogenase [Saccharothrix carnea]|uniref:Alkylation response protein AidB-like acyl-CoA dehydrogenase n=1 Tax=Saccharothrix carnea TaxID=1280637 RepID=A0A2P8I0J5_SACCR|nr:acyl-CoA dehydrogenase family protein [Saccharothrix carnea]PSL51990.1 alkylation response protein AidB-like acyl-CoA dehydrogenase [Saccharothrix carnea]
MSSGPVTAPDDRMASLRAGLEEDIKPLGDRYTDDQLPLDLLPEIVKTLRGHGYPMDDPSDEVTRALASEELARVFPSLEGCLMISYACARYITAAGPPDLRERAVPGLLGGEKIGCLASTEPDHGSNNAAMQTRAVPDGDEYVINGRKRWISNADISDYAVVLCRVVEDDGREEIRPIIVERERSPYRTRDLPKLGLTAFVTSEMVFEDCRVPRENCLGPAGSLRNLQLVFKTLQWARCRMAVVSLGIARAALEASVAYARRRRQFGRLIGEFQLIQDKIYHMAAEIDASRLLIHRALTSIEENRRADREASMAKAYATEVAVRVASEAIQIHGANGLSPDYPTERYFRDARALTIAEGTTEIHKLVVARSVLGLTAFQ